MNMSIMNKQHRKENRQYRLKNNPYKKPVVSQGIEITNLYIVWLMHFGDVTPGKETCSDCQDFITKQCKGENRKGEQCVDCMAQSLKRGTIIFSN